MNGTLWRAQALLTHSDSWIVVFPDMTLGHAHLIPFDDRESRKDGHDFVS